MYFFFFLIYHDPLKTPVNSYSVDFQNQSWGKALTSSPTTCCPQNFLATYTVHEPQRGLLCPIAGLKAQPVSCVIINPLSPEDTQTERSLRASLHRRDFTTILSRNSHPFLNAKWSPLFPISSFFQNVQFWARRGTFFFFKKAPNAKTMFKEGKGKEGRGGWRALPEACKMQAESKGWGFALGSPGPSQTSVMETHQQLLWDEGGLGKGWQEKPLASFIKPE